MSGGKAHGAGSEAPKARRISPLEIVASAAGLLLTLAMLAFIGWEALTRPGDAMPAVTVEPGRISQIDGIWVVAFDAVNRTPATAASVEIVGRLKKDGGVVETGRIVLDYVPGGASVNGGLFFRSDPREHEMEIQAQGFAKP